MKNTGKLAVLLLFALGACKQAVKPGLLQGKWAYERVEELNHSADSTTALDIELNKPTIEFRANGELRMTWGNETLSQGTYVIDGDNVQYTEQLADGKKRTFPFHVTHLDEKRIIFETTDRAGARVTAKRL